MKTRRHKRMTRMIMAAAFLSLLGCNSYSLVGGDSPVDRNWSISYESAKRNQILNPGKEASDAPVTGLDGQSAMETLARHRNSFKGGGQKTTYQLNIGGLSAGGGK